MREIKFRAWDIEYNRWARPEDISIQGDGTAWIDRSASDYEDVIDTIDGDEQGAIIEQFTGLHDSKGREIYEGDRVRYGQISGDAFDGVVEYDAPEFVVSPEMDCITCSPLMLASYEGWHIEIIGNIHESE